MNSNFILDKSLVQWKNQFPLLDDLISTKEVFWTNPEYRNFSHAINKIDLSLEDVKDAEARLQRFSSYISKVFPDTKPQNGLIESPIKHIPNMKKYLESISDKPVQGSLYLKCDSHLAISGSIKARGGIYEVLKHAEGLAMEKGLLNVTDDYSIMDSAAYRDFFSDYTIAVGSTGNLGLSIGIMSAKLGFKVFVHMSADAKQWKKDLLRSKGVTVVEYESDYSKAVEEGRKQSDLDPNSYFVDDENSINLFLGYAVAALRLEKQLSDSNVTIDSNNPLFVYLPCGVGGGPGGVAFGLKLIFGDNVHCFFAEPTHSPCMLIGCMTGYHDKVCVQDFGIDNITAADGLAVGRASGFVGRTLHELLSGDYTVDDDRLYILLHELANREKIYLEPSALAGVYGPVSLFSSEFGQTYLKSNGLLSKLDNITHIAWATGGSMVPENEMKKYYEKGSNLSNNPNK